MKTVVTHSGRFHADDVFAVATIMLIEGKDNVRIVRTRDQSAIRAADWVVDVGGEYEPKRLRFDHHQPGAPTRENGIDYAAFGLVWRHYGEILCDSKEVADSIAEDLVIPVDAGDVGVSLYNVNDHGVAPVELHDVLNVFLPPWESNETDDDQFLVAVDFARQFLQRKILRTQARFKMKKYAKKLYELSANKAVLVTEIPVSAAEYTEHDDVKCVISPDKAQDGFWVVTTIPAAENTFERKNLFPESWSGLRDEDLAVVSGIKGAVFCHKARFIFVANSKQDALKAAEYLE